MAAHALAGAPLTGFAIPSVDAVVRTISLETDNAVDDVAIHMVGSWSVHVQAKRSLRPDAVFAKAAEQWREAALQGLDPTRDRLAIVAGQLSGSMRLLAEVLRRYKNAVPGSFTVTERRVLDKLVTYLRPLTEEQVRAVLSCAVIYELDVESDESPSAREAMTLLGTLLTSESPVHGPSAFTHLRAHAGVLATQRSGDDIAGWMRVLRGAGAAVRVDGATPSSQAARVDDALDRYRARLVAQGETLDLAWLGAALPPIDLAAADAGVSVLSEADVERDARGRGHELTWAFLRRGRAILTGLPGSGKSTSVRVLAARLCRLSVAPLPVLVSLRDVDGGDRTVSIRDRIVELAVAANRPADRDLIRDVINHGLDHGGVALLLDALDETYERRAEVVQEIRTMLRDLSPDVDVLLVTRDVGYGHASTLSWPRLMQARPAHSDKLVNAVLSAAQAHAAPSRGSHPDGSAGQQSSEELHETTTDRLASWVQTALEQHRTLLETPLMPVLLALLASERSRAVLPQTRAATLIEVVHDVVGRYELKRRPDLPLGRLGSTQLHDALMHVFGVQATVILEQRGEANYRDVVQRIASEVADYWDLSRGDAITVAKDAIRFFDESGIFVMTGATQSISPRIALFAEIGAAWYATAGREQTLTQWVDERLDLEQHEPLILAAVLNTDAAAALGSRAAASSDPTLLATAVRAHTEGATFSSANLHNLQARHIEQFAQGGLHGWDHLTALLKLDVQGPHREAIERAAEAFDTPRQQLVRAILDLRLNSDTDNRNEPANLLAALKVRSLGRLSRTEPEQRTTRGTFDLGDLGQEKLLLQTQVAAASLLVPTEPAAATAAARLAAVEGYAYDPFRNILAKHGISFSAPEDNVTFPAAANFFANFPRDTHQRTLNILLDLNPHAHLVPLTFQQQMRMHEIATFLETLNMNDGGCHHLLENTQEATAAFALFARLFKFDLAVIAAQAHIIKARVEDEGFDTAVIAAQAHIIKARVEDEGFDTAAFYAVFDDATSTATDADWGEIADLAQAMETLATMQRRGRSHAWSAAHALWDCKSGPTHDAAVAMMESQFDRVAGSHEHLRIITTTLLAVTNGQRLTELSTHRYPAVREATLRSFRLTPDQKLAAGHIAAVADPDGYVRETALEAAAKLKPVNLANILKSAASDEDAGWICRHCNTPNPPGSGPTPGELRTVVSQVGNRTLTDVGKIAEALRGY